MHLELIYQDPSLVAINKPPGLLVHRSPIDQRETRFAVQLLRHQLGQPVWPVHRLDKPTSGVLLFALDAETARDLAGQFARREVGKRYLAVLRGYCPSTLHIEHPVKIQPDPLDPKEAGRPDYRLPAETWLRRLASVELPVRVDRYATSRYSLAELVPVTGRRHQLRKHMKHISHPILGDTSYGKGRHNQFFQRQLGCDRLLLACVNLSLQHPATGERINLQASPGAEFHKLFNLLPWRDSPIG